MNRSVIVVAVIFLASGAVILPSAAAPFGTDTINGDLVLAPTDGPNGDYAYYDDDDELAIGFGPMNPKLRNGTEGVLTETVTSVDRVFTISNTDADLGRVWLTVDSAAITFYRGDDTDASVTGEVNAIVIEPGESVTVGVRIDARDGEVGATTLTLHAEPVVTPDKDDTPEPTDTPTATPTSAPTDTPTATATPSTPEVQTTVADDGVGTDGAEAKTPAATTGTPQPTQSLGGFGIDPISLALLVIGAGVVVVAMIRLRFGGDT